MREICVITGARAECGLLHWVIAQAMHPKVLAIQDKWLCEWTNLSCGGFSIEGIGIGMSASYSRTITDADVKSFAGFSGDNNPGHMSDKFAA